MMTQERKNNGISNDSSFLLISFLFETIIVLTKIVNILAAITWVCVDISYTIYIFLIRFLRFDVFRCGYC